VKWSLLLLCACAKASAPEPDEEAAGPVTVTCVAAQPASATSWVEARGVVGVAPDRGAIVASTAAGRIARVDVKEGDVVAAGARLATIDDPTLAAGVAEADAAIAAAQAGASNADAIAARAKRLVEQGVAPRRDVEDADARKATAAAELAAARAKAELAHRQQARGTVVAPIAGTVIHVLRHAGELVDGTPATAIVELADPHQLELHADVAAADLVRLRVGQPAAVALDALPAQPLAATIVAVAPAVTTATALGGVRAQLDAPPHLVLGLAGTLRIELPRAAGAVSVPASAVRRGADGTTQVVVCGDKARVVAVVVGTRAPYRVELTGLAPGTPVVVDHVLGIEDGAALAVRK